VTGHPESSEDPGAANSGRPGSARRGVRVLRPAAAVPVAQLTGNGRVRMPPRGSGCPFGGAAFQDLPLLGLDPVALVGVQRAQVVGGVREQHGLRIDAAAPRARLCFFLP
jgi:hypothetical protein